MTRKSIKRPPRLFDRVAAILEEARASVVRTVNTRMVVAYWLIGREIVQEQQGGQRRAGYGDALLENLSRRLTERYGKGYSVSSLKDFRQFHLCFADRLPPISHTTCGELGNAANEPAAIHHTACGELPRPAQAAATAARGAGSQSVERRRANPPPASAGLHGAFAQQLSWSHYRLYVNYYDRELCAPDDNPTVGLILCTARNEPMVQYTLPKGQKQIFAARYRTALPSEEDLVKLLRRDWDMVVREQQAAYGGAGCE